MIHEEIGVSRKHHAFVCAAEDISAEGKAVTLMYYALGRSLVCLAYANVQRK